ncbi:PHD finger protein rhinoceros-like isoform X4 [Macrobrachium nipponense]|uniref:PHD finger protein rhinoceros-like isoform X4 n=1 Tax=Macrobrachium nipponense TaxID=159736 RepID=UPI0030C8B075
MVSDKPKKVLGFLKSKAKKRERDSSKTRSSRDSEDLRVEGGRHPPERRESGRFPSAARLLRSLGRNRDDEGGGARARDTSEPSLSRGNPHYHSEGKGLKKKNNWTSERELNSVSPTQKERSHSFCEKTDAKRRFSYHENKVLREEAKTRLDRQEEEGPLQADGTPLPSEASPVHSALSSTISSSASQVPSSPTTPCVPSSAQPLSNEKGEENIYENLPAHMNTSDTVTLSACDGQKQPDSVERLQNEVQTARPLERADKDRRSVRKLTKDSGYETSPYSEGDYANIDLYSDADALPDGDGDDVTLAPECELAPPSPLLESATHISGSSSPSIQNTPTSTHQHSPSQLSISGSQERRSSWQLPGSGSSSNIAAAAVSHQPDLCAARGVSPSCTSLSSSSQGASHEARSEANSNTSNSRFETRLETTSNNTSTLTKRSANTANKSSASRRSPLPRYPSAESLSSFAESLVSPGGASSSSLVPAKSTPSLHQNASGQAHNFSIRHSSVNAALHASRSTPNLDDAEDGSMVTKKSSMYSYLQGTSSPSSKGGMGGSGVVGGRYWDVTMGADDTPDREDYAHHLRSSSYQLLHSRQLSALSSGSAGSYHSRQHSNTSNYSETDDLSPRADLSSSHSHHSHHHGIDRPRFFSYDNLGPDSGSHKYHGSWNISEPDLTSAPPPYSPPGPNYQQAPTPPSTTASTVRHSPTSNSSSGRHPSSPPPPPVRDASSLKYIKYGPGHEKYPSWPVPAASANQVIHPGSSHDANVSGLPDSTSLSPAPQGSHRSKSWTEQSEYPKEKAGGYARPFNKKPSNQAYHRQLKTVMERSEKLPKEVFHSNLREEVFSGSDYSFMDAYCKSSSFYPSYDRDGRTLDDKDYRSPSPPERDIGMGEATFGQVTAAQLEEHRRRYEDYNYDLIGTTPLLDQLRCDSLIWEGNTERDSVRGESESVADSSRYSNGRESVTTVVTNSSSASSSETLKWHGSLSDISIMSGHSRDPRADHNIVHSSRVQAPQRHNSESVLYYGADGRGKPPHGRLGPESRDHRDLRRSIRDTESGYPRPSREGKWSREVERNNEMNNLKKFPSYSYTQPLSQITEAPSAEMRETPRSPTRSMQSPTVDCSKPPSVAERIHELERQSRTTVSENSTRGPRDQSNSRERDNREVRDRRDSREREPQEMRERDSRDCKDRGTRESRRSLDETCSQEVHELGQTPEVRPAREPRDPSETRGHQRRGSRDSQRGDMRLDFSRLEKEPPSLTGSDTLRSPTTPGSAGSTSSRSPTSKEQDSGRAFVHENFQNILNTFTEVDRGDRMDRLSSNVSYSYLDPEKRRKVPDATLKSIQKQAVMSFVYERHGGRGMTGQSVSDLSSASSQSSLISSHSAPETTQAKWSTVQQQHPSNQNMRTDKSGKAGKGMARLGRVPESEGDEQTVRHSRRRSMSGRDSGSECGTEDLSRGGSQRSSLASDAASSRGEQPPAFPQKQAQQHPHPEVVARSSSTSSAHSTSANEDPKPTEEAEPCRDDDGASRASSTRGLLEGVLASSDAIATHDPPLPPSLPPPTPDEPPPRPPERPPKKPNLRSLFHGQTSTASGPHPNALSPLATANGLLPHTEKTSPDSEMRRIEESANELRNLPLARPYKYRKPPAPDPPKSPEATPTALPKSTTSPVAVATAAAAAAAAAPTPASLRQSRSSPDTRLHAPSSLHASHLVPPTSPVSRSSTPDLPPPPPPPLTDGEVVVNDEPLPPPPSEVAAPPPDVPPLPPDSPPREMLTATPPPVPRDANKSMMTPQTYHKDSYMAHRRDWKTGFEGRYRRTISPSAANRNLLYNRDDNTNNNQSNASNNNNNINNSSSSATSTSPLPLPPQEQQERRNSSTPPGGGTILRNHSTSNLVQTNNSKNANDYDSSVNNNGWTCHGHTTSTTVNFTAEELRAFKARRAHAHIQDAGALPLEKDGGGRPLHTSQSSPALSSALRSAASDGSTTSLASGGGGSSLSSGHSGSGSPTKLSPASSLRASVDSLHRPSSSTSTITSHSPRPITRATSLVDPLHPPDDLSVARSNSMSQEAIHFTSTASINESLSRISAINDSLSRSTSMAESLCRSTSVTEAPSVAPAGPQIHAHNASETASPSSSSSPPHQSSPSSAPAAASTVPTAPASPTSPVPHDGPITAHPATVTEEVSPGPPPPLTISNKSLTTKSPPSPKSPLASKSLTPVSPLSPMSPFSSKSPVSSTSPVLSPTSSKMCAFPSVSNSNNSSVSNNPSSTTLAVTSSLDTTTTATTTLSYPITSPSMSPATLPVDHSIIVLSYGRTRYQEEIDCDLLSKDYGPQLTVDSKLLALLAPGPEYKTAAHYMQGVFSLELRKDFISSTHAQHPDLSHIHQNSAMPPNTSTATNGVANTSNEKAPLPSDSAYFTTSESKAKLLTRLRGNGSSLQDGVPTVTDQQQLHKKKEELVASIGRKLEILRAEREAIKEEMRLNQELGSEVTSLVEERARLAESEKYKLHVEEIDKITSLLLGLSGRLARAENALMLSKEADPEERRILEGKRDKLSEQLEEAKRLKENIDRRAIQVSKVLNQYLNEDEYADYDHFIKMKAKLIMDAREIDDKIKLGEEQQQALIETICKK